MMDLGSIRAYAAERAQQAAEQNLKPYLVEEDDLLLMRERRSFPFPFLGDYVPEGWEQTENEYFVDSSGFGADDEPALSIPQFLEKIRVGYGYGITQAGQFQVYVQEYRRLS